MEQKRQIVAESLGPGLTPTEVARKHRISSRQLYTWRQQLMSVQGPAVIRSNIAVVESRLVIEDVGSASAQLTAWLERARAVADETDPLADGLEAMLQDHEGTAEKER